MVGLLKPDSGFERVCGIDVKNRVEVLKRVGYIPKDPVIFPYLTAEEVLRYSAKLRDLKNFEDRICYLLEIFNLKPNKVVAGMSKRIGDSVDLHSSARCG
ncbi:hypothetical protein [Archaeoglobus sp.]